MALETGSYINSLNVNNPAAKDGLSQADDHMRLIKSTVKATFPAVTGAVTSTHTELNYSDGVTSNIQTQMNTKLQSFYGYRHAQYWVKGSSDTGAHSLGGLPSIVQVYAYVQSTAVHGYAVGDYVPVPFQAPANITGDTKNAGFTLAFNATHWKLKFSTENCELLSLATGQPFSIDSDANWQFQIHMHR